MALKLKEAREAAGYSIEEVSKILKIRKQYIIGLEEETFSEIPGQIYIDGYTKIYYEFLGLDCPIKSNIPINTSKLVKVEDKIDKRYIVVISTVILVAVIALYVYLKSSTLNKILPLNDLTNNMIRDHGNNEATIN